MKSISGINSIPYIDLTDYIDLKSYDILRSEICRGIATTHHLAINGSHTCKPGSINPDNFKALYEAYEELQLLSEDSAFKKSSKGLTYNQLTTYLKYGFGGYDLYSILTLFENSGEQLVLGEVAGQFPNLIKWIENLKTLGIFSAIRESKFFLLEAGGVPLEHCDPVDNEEQLKWYSEFVHIKTDLDRPFYLINRTTREKTYINTRVAWWNERDWHGGEPINRPTYTLRIDGQFTEEFRNKILGSSL
jgi:hypothetical protein